MLCQCVTGPEEDEWLLGLWGAACLAHCQCPACLPSASSKHVDLRCRVLSPVQVRDRATLYITQLQEADGQPVPQPAPWNISSKSLEAALQAYLEDGGQSAPFDLVRGLLTCTDLARHCPAGLVALFFGWCLIGSP